MNKIVRVLKFVLPEFAYELIKPIGKFLINANSIQKIKRQVKYHKKNLRRVTLKAEKGEDIVAAFFILSSSVWKYDNVYKLLNQDERFNTIIVVCPIVNYGKENMLAEMDKTYNFFVEKGYNVVKSYIEETNEYLDIKKVLNPDIVFYANPYKGLNYNKYYITEFKDFLTVYVPYGYYIGTIHEAMFDFLFHNLLWKGFYPTEIHVKLAENVARNKGRNIINSKGYPGVDNLAYGICTKENVWRNINLKKVIWAPHHSIESGGIVKYSSFLNYCDEMLKIAKLFKDKIEFAFKPHPLLKLKLYNHPDWGKERTDSYYEKWKTGTNTFLHDDNYTDLFNSSEAMIFDSASFIAEYLATGKPSLFMFADNYEDIISQLNDFGKMAMKYHNHAFNVEEIIVFLKNICKGYDFINIERQEFISRLLRPNLKTSASENIYNEIISSIFTKA